MSEVFSNTSYVSIAITIIALYLLIYIWIYYLEDHKLMNTDFIFFIGKLVNQPFPTNAIKINRVSSIILLRTFDFFTFAITVIFGCVMLQKVLSKEEKMRVIDSMDQLENMKNIKVYIIYNKFVYDVIDDIDSLKRLKTAGYFFGFVNQYCIFQANILVFIFKVTSLLKSPKMGVAL